MLDPKMPKMDPKIIDIGKTRSIVIKRYLSADKYKFVENRYDYKFVEDRYDYSFEYDPETDSYELMKKHKTQEQLKASSREKLVNIGIVQICKAENCLIGSDMQPLSPNGYCFSCAQSMLQKELDEIDAVLDAELQEETKTLGIF